MLLTFIKISRKIICDERCMVMANKRHNNQSVFMKRKSLHCICCYVIFLLSMPQAVLAGGNCWVWKQSSSWQQLSQGQLDSHLLHCLHFLSFRKFLFSPSAIMVTFFSTKGFSLVRLQSAGGICGSGSVSKPMRPALPSFAPARGYACSMKIFNEVSKSLELLK